MKYLFPITIFLFSLYTHAQRVKHNQLTKEEKEAGWELLFNGKNLNNWKIFKGGEVVGWKIINGVLHNSGIGSDHGGDIITKKQYKDFELFLEWNIAPQSNSGIFFHVQENEVEAIYQSAPEYQLLDDKGWPTKLEEHQYSGANYAMHAPENAEVKPAGEWNQTRIIVKASNVKHYLNNTLVVEYELWSNDWKERKKNGKWKDYPLYGTSTSGHIGLQDHGGLTRFRNIKIREL